MSEFSMTPSEDRMEGIGTDKSSAGILFETDVTPGGLGVRPKDGSVLDGGG